jgi:hypothetical protein
MACVSYTDDGGANLLFLEDIAYGYHRDAGRVLVGYASQSRQ